MQHFLKLLLFILIPICSTAQNGLLDDMQVTEEKLKASTKQLNQFVKRFNGEEDQQGKALLSADKRYRSGYWRKKFVPELVDHENQNISSETIESFVKEITDKKNAQFLDFHDTSWFAEVGTVFYYKGKESPLLLYMRIQQQGLGYEWIIEDVAFEPFKKMYSKDTTSSKPFLHPMSHELQFMNLHKAFREGQNPESYTPDGFSPDMLTLFLYELKRGSLKFKTVTNLKYHFFTIDNWYFEVSNFNRPGYNTGWLISNMMKVTPDQEKLLKNYIYDKL